MDRRSWPWKKKSSDKSAAEKAISTLDSAGVSLASGGSQTDKDNNIKSDHVQVPVELYTHLRGLEDQINAYEEQLKSLDERIEELNEKLSDSHSEMTNKDELVKQHAKVAEEAVSGWEKAEAEAAALKTHLEAMTISNLTTEDRAAHLDGALKECMRQIRNLKDDHDQKVRDIIATKNLQHDRLKREFEARIAGLNQELQRSAAENDALSRSLQERSNMLIEMREEKSQAEAEIEQLKSNVESYEREINSLKYELHLVSKELDIRNEEKNMSFKSAESANKQHLEGVKKIAKLEAECQRLRGLVRKKLPGPAALAQMKLEVESLGREYGETRHKRSPSRPPSPLLSSNPHIPSVAEFSLDGAPKLQKENGFLTERLLVTEEETKMLKEALAKRNSELQASRSVCAKTASKLHSLEAQLHANSQLKGSAETHSVQNNSMSLTSLSEDGHDDSTSVADSWTPDKIKDKSNRADNTNSLELMDDFLEMEKFARLSDDSNGAIDNKGSLICDANGNKQSEVNSASPVTKVQSRISKVFESFSEDSEIEEVLGKLKLVVQELYDTMHPHSISCVFEEKHCSEDTLSTPVKEVPLLENDKTLSTEMLAAVSEIHTFIQSFAKEAVGFMGTSEMGLFSTSYGKVMRNELSLADFIVALSDVVLKAGDFNFSSLGFKNNATEVNSPDCIIKVALPENKESQIERYSNGCSHSSDASSDPEFPSLDVEPLKSSDEGFEQLKKEKENMVRELARSIEDLETTRFQLKETEQRLADTKLELANSLKTNSLAETQLKCMAESYRLLEKRAEELNAEVSLLRTRAESLEIGLQSEKVGHHDTLMRFKELEEEMQRNKECSMCSSMAADLEDKSKQEKELAAAAEKLAECQETIFLLGKQLKSLQPHTNLETHLKNDELNLEPATDARDSQHHPEADTTAPPTNTHKSPSSPSDAESSGLSRLSTSSKPSSYKAVISSGSSSTSSGSASDKHSRVFSRFFSSKSSGRH